MRLAVGAPRHAAAAGVGQPAHGLRLAAGGGHHPHVAEAPTVVVEVGHPLAVRRPRQGRRTQEGPGPEQAGGEARVLPRRDVPHVHFGTRVYVGELGPVGAEAWGDVLALSRGELGLGLRDEVVHPQLRRPAPERDVCQPAGVRRPVEIRLGSHRAGDPLGRSAVLGGGGEHVAVGDERHLLSVGREGEVPEPVGQAEVLHGGDLGRTPQGDGDLGRAVRRAASWPTRRSRARRPPCRRRRRCGGRAAGLPGRR